jgi:hypothetical protein
MKSILALICLVVLATADVQKSGGLKGSWTDEFEVENAAVDMAAPGIAYSATHTTALVCDSTGFSSSYTVNTTEEAPYTTDCDLYFLATGELTYAMTSSYQLDWEETGSYMVSYWTGTVDDPTNVITADCDCTDGGLEVTCSFYLPEHTVPGLYTPMITLMDSQGNWAVYDDTDFATAGNGVTFTVQSNDPDVMAPVIDATSYAMVPATGEVVLGMVSNIDTSVDVTISLLATDGQISSTCVSTVAGYDGWSSGLAGVMVTVTWGEGEDTVTKEWMMSSDWTTITASCNYMFELEFNFYNFASVGTWTISKFTAWDMAYNMMEWVPTTMNTIDISYDDTALEAAGGVFSCQTFDVYVNILDVNEDLVITATEGGQAVLSMTCVEKDETASNYAAVGFRTETYIPVGETMATRRWTWSYGAGTPYGGDYEDECNPSGISINCPVWQQSTNMGENVEYTVADPDWTAYNYAPGTDNFFAGIWTSYVQVYPGWQDGDYELAQIYTITATGGVQLYDIALGSASSVVPSIFAVAIAAVVALLRL